jgi:hypothetical protein
MPSSLRTLQRHHGPHSALPISWSQHLPSTCMFLENQPPMHCRPSRHKTTSRSGLSSSLCCLGVKQYSFSQIAGCPRQKLSSLLPQGQHLSGPASKCYHYHWDCFENQIPVHVSVPPSSIEETRFHGEQVGLSARAQQGANTENKQSCLPWRQSPSSRRVWSQLTQCTRLPALSKSGPDSVHCRLAAGQWLSSQLQHRSD